MALLHTYLVPLVLALLAVVLLQTFWISSINNRLTRQTRSLRTFFSTAGGEDIEELLRTTLDRSEVAARQSNAALTRLDDLGTTVTTCLQHVGLTRYDAFGDVTGQQSFSLAMLDGRDNGAVITALFARNTCRCYGKMIIEGQPEQLLTDEEQQALIKALQQKVGAK